MKLVRLKAARPNYRRVLNREDLARRNIHISTDLLVWDDANNHILEMSNQASDSLVAEFSSEFEIVGDDADDSESEEPQENQEVTAGDETDDLDESDDEDELVD